VSIHPLALVSPRAEIGAGVEIGPFCIVEPQVSIGAGCILEGRVTVRDGTTLGAGNHVCEGAVLGGMPQHIHMPESPGRVIIGEGNVFRENVTVHRAMKADAATIIGDHNFVMCNTHIAHDCRVGNHCILTANVLLAGHVTVSDRANLSGAAAVHQFCRVGPLAMVGGQAHITRDVPPFVTVDGLSSFVVGLNQVGLRRAGYDQQTVAQLKAAYRVIYRSGLPWREILERLRTEFDAGLAAAYYPFLVETTRGIIGERRGPPNATIKLRVAADSEPDAAAEPALRAKIA
jgi:UDP-N-acetylglucosamine acyltransferase